MASFKKLPEGHLPCRYAYNRTKGVGNNLLYGKISLQKEYTLVLYLLFYTFGNFRISKELPLVTKNFFASQLAASHSTNAPQAREQQPKRSMGIFTVPNTYTRLFYVICWLLTSFVGYGQTITGTVFRDFNSNGRYESITDPTAYTYGEPGVGALTITAYDAQGSLVATTTSSSEPATLGSYTLTVGSTATFRIEFTGLILGDAETLVGPDQGTSIQFVNGGSTAVNFGVNYPNDFCQSAAPPLLTTCFVAVDAAQASADFTARPAMVGVPYTADDDSKVVTDYATLGEIGSAWGLAFKQDTRQLFSAAFTKRHVGFSAGGPNAIYVTTPTSATSGNTTEFFNFSSVGGSAVSLLSETHGNDLPTTSASLASHDDVAYDAVGKTSLGGLAISDDQKTLFVLNLKNRNLYTIDVATKQATGIAIPNPGCVTSSSVADGSYRPFAVTYYRGKVYVGVVCTREDLGSSPVPYGPTDGLSATVFAMDATLPGSFTTVLSFPLTYRKGATNADVLPDTITNPARDEFWRPWTSIFQPDRYEGVVSYPQPWLTSIAFEPTTGDMLIGLRDRFGDQTGLKNYKPFTTETTLVSGICPGEILRARKCTPTDSQWTLENGGSLCGTATSASATQTTVAGPGNGKYYWGDRVQDGVNHQMSSQGSLAQLGGSAKLAMTAINPTDVFNTGGIKRLINATGAKDGHPTGAYPNPLAGVIYYTDDELGFGKANGLGDLELLCDRPPVEIGNRVWLDRNNNGIQDPGEPPLANVVVQLSGPGLSGPASVTTNARGEYYFTNATGTTTTGITYGLTGLTAGGSYTLSFPIQVDTLSLSAKSHSATGFNATRIDSDPNEQGVVLFTLGDAGQNNFTYDAAYAPCSLSLAVTAGTCSSATNQYTLSGTVRFTNIPTGILTLSDGFSSTTLAVSAGTDTLAFALAGLSSDGISHTLTASYSSTVCMPVHIAYTAPASCSVGLGISVTDPGTCNATTNTYTATGLVSVTNVLAGIATLTDGLYSTTLTIPTGTTSIAYSLTGLTSGTGSHTLTISLANVQASTTYEAPASCGQPILSITKLVDKTVAERGDTLTYTLVVTNSGPEAATNLSIRDSLSAGLSYLIQTATVSPAVNFTLAGAISIWSIAKLSAGQSLSLVFQAKADSTGILYNTATIPGDTARVCTSVPVHMCVGDEYAFLLTATAGRSYYQWYRNGVALSGANSYTLEVSTPGSYSLSVDQATGQCADFSCCPFILVEDSLPVIQATAVPATCLGTVVQSNGQLVVQPTHPEYTFQYSAGTTFTETASLSGLPQPVPASGILTQALPNPLIAQAYTIRIYTPSGCYSDVTVVLTPTTCSCPADRCVPFVINQSKRGPRIGDPR